MLYTSIDIETTGLDPERCQVLSIGAIIEDTEKKLPLWDIPKFHSIVLHKELTGSPHAITMNKKIIELIDKYYESDDKGKIDLSQIIDFYTPDEVAPAFFDFLWKNGIRYSIPLDKEVRFVDKVSYPIIGSRTKPLLLNVAGKNFKTFDNLFLNKLPWWQKLIITKQRVIDPAILYCDWKNDESLPSLNECKKRAGISGEVSHDAIEDAWDVIQVLRKFY